MRRVVWLAPWPCLAHTCGSVALGPGPSLRVRRGAHRVSAGASPGRRPQAPAALTPPAGLPRSRKSSDQGLSHFGTGVGGAEHGRDRVLWQRNNRTDTTTQDSDWGSTEDGGSHGSGHRGRAFPHQQQGGRGGNAPVALRFERLPVPLDPALTLSHAYQRRSAGHVVSVEHSAELAFHGLDAK
jgi:hypothetical protein